MKLLNLGLMLCVMLFLLVKYQYYFQNLFLLFECIVFFTPPTFQPFNLELRSKIDIFSWDLFVPHMNVIEQRRVCTMQPEIISFMNTFPVVIICTLQRSVVSILLSNITQATLPTHIFLVITFQLFCNLQRVDRLHLFPGLIQ